MPWVTLRPNATVSFSGTVTGAASAHAALATPGDSAYVVGAGSSVFGVFDMDTFALPAGAVTLNARLDMRVRSVTATETVFASTDPDVGFESRVANIIATDNWGQLNPVSLSQAQINGLRVSIGVPPTGSGTNARFHSVEVQLGYVLQPVTAVTAVTPDPWTASTQVPIEWVNTLDTVAGGNQTRYEVKVFDSATFTDGGFNPASSAPVWTSGVQLSSATGATTGPLLTGDTYRVYVRVAQTVNGAAHWSAWAHDEFDVDVDTADIDAVVAAPHDAIARIVVTVTRDAGSEAWELIEVERSTDAGVSWQPVRTATLVAPGDPDEFVVADYETGNQQNALYRARATYHDAGLPITGAWVQSPTPVAWESADCWLKSPANPAKNVTVWLDNPSARQTRPVPSGVFWPIGARRAIVVTDGMQAASSELRILTDGAAEKRALLDLLDDIFLLFHPTPALMIAAADTNSVYLAVQAGNEDWRFDNVPELRLWPVPYVETDPPPDPTAGSL